MGRNRREGGGGRNETGGCVIAVRRWTPLIFTTQKWHGFFAAVSAV